MRKFNIYYRGKHTDTVFFDKTCDAEYVKDSLINHDGYPIDIVAREIVK